MVTGSGPDDTGAYCFASGGKSLRLVRSSLDPASSAGRRRWGLRGYAKHHSRLPGQAER